MSQPILDFDTPPWELVNDEPVEAEPLPKAGCENCRHNLPLTTKSIWCTLMAVRQEKSHVCGNYGSGRHRNYNEWMKQ